MRKFFALLCAVVCLAGVSFAQADHAGFGEQMQVAVHRASGLHETQSLFADTLSFGPNQVCVTAKHPDGAVFYRECNHNLKTTWGVDAMAANVSGTSLGAFTYLNLSTNSSTPAASDCVTAPCTLAGLLTSDGLSPASATYAHTAGTSTFTLTYTWTDSTAATSNVQKAAISTAACTGTTCNFAYENTFTPVSLNVGDQLQVVWTITIS